MEELYFMNIAQPCNLQPATCNLQPATCNLQPATCNLQPATCNLQPLVHAALNSVNSFSPL